MLNNKKENWQLIKGDEVFPPFNEKVMILVEEDCLWDEEHDTEGDRYYPFTFYAILSESYQWELLHESEECEQMVLQSQTVVAWRPI
jgi:hypothetical protein